MGHTKTVSFIEKESSPYKNGSQSVMESGTQPFWYWASSLALIIAILSVVIYKLWRRTDTRFLTTKRAKIKKHLKRFYSFFRQVWYENSIECTIGASGQVLFIVLLILNKSVLKDILHIDLSHFTIYYVIYSLIFYSLWATPVLKNLFANFDSLNLKLFRFRLTNRIERIRNHYIIFGYGNIGKSIVCHFFENYTDTDFIYSEGRFNRQLLRAPKIKNLDNICLNFFKSFKVFFQDLRNKELYKKSTARLLDEADKQGITVLLLERFYNDKYDDVLFCNNLIIVDKDECLINNVFVHPILGKIGVVILEKLNCLRNDNEYYDKKIYIPAIVGNVKESSTLNLSRLGNSKMVLSLVLGEDSTYHLFSIIAKGRKRKAIMSNSSTNEEYYLTPKSYDTNISFLHNYRTRGWALGNIVSASIFGVINNNDNIDHIRILILGQGKQLHFLLEKIWFEVLWQKGSRSIEASDISDWDDLLLEIQKNTFKEQLLTSNLIETLKTEDAINLTDAMKNEITANFNTIKDNLTFYEDKVANENVIYPLEIQKELYINQLEDVFEFAESWKLKINEQELSDPQKEDIKKFNITILKKLFPQILSYNSMKFFRNNCLIVGNDEYINNTTITSDGKVYWNHEIAYISKKIYKDDNYLIQIPYLKGIPYDPALLGPLVYGLENKQKLGNENQKIQDNDPFQKVNPNFFKRKPDIIVVTSDSHEDVGRTLHELNNTIRKYDIKLEQKPKIIVESDSSIREVAMQLNKEIIRKNSQKKPPRKYPISLLNQPFPLEFSENVVNSFSDGNKTIFGYIEAMSAQKGVTIKSCIEDKPGSLAKLCFLLAKLKFDLDELYNFNGISHIPSFHNTQVLAKKNNHFSFSSDADLLEIEKGENIPINIEDNPEHIREAFVSSHKQEWRKKIAGDPDSLIKNKKLKGDEIDNGCIGMVFCPIYSFENSIKSESNDMIKKDKKYARCRCDEKAKRITILPNNRYKDYAKIYASCTGANELGSFAMLLYKLMFGTQIPTERGGNNYALNIKYITNTECYNPGFTFVNIYGNFLEDFTYKGQNLKKQFSRILDGIVISPIGIGKNWFEYSKNLQRILNNGNGMQYNLFTSTEENGDYSNILILSEDCQDALLGEYILLFIEKTVEEYYLESDDDDLKEEEKKPFKQQHRKLELLGKFKNAKIDKKYKDNYSSFQGFLDSDGKDCFKTNIRNYLEAKTSKKYSKEKEEEETDNFDKYVNGNFETTIDNDTSCQCSIPDSPFKNKALYLLTNVEKYKENLA